MAMALGGPSDDRGPPLRQTHARMASKDLDDSGFDAFLGYFEDVQQELGVPAEQIAEVMPIFHGARRDVLNH
jgi:truncated hemoglobin YjbI